MDQIRCDEFQTTIIGATGSGLKSFIIRLIRETWLDDYYEQIDLIETEFRKVMKVDDDFLIFEVSAHLWGREDEIESFTFMQHACKKSQGFIFMYSVLDHSSYEFLETKIENVLQVIDKDDFSNHPSIIFGNKMDLSMNERGVTLEEGQELANRYTTLFSEISIKNNININEMMDELFRLWITIGMERDEIRIQNQNKTWFQKNSK